MESLISIVLIRIFCIDELFWNIDLDPTENIDNLLESREVNDDIVVDRLTRELTHFISKVLHSDLICLSDFIEAVDATSTFPFRIGDIEIARNREESDTLLLTIEGCEHDRVREVTAFMPSSSDPCDENIHGSYILH